ncbi:CbtA family protein [Actinocrispum wychmicini]|uniref:Putative cobalt transporter subunit CbtA n=1 Tax=Actinocrispum wychmicini TaxID=1213861 RepID=A0A4R2INZ1_9PSEU|nr:CbtA family protein [Actinocrispum wychmicini]TCO46547.1 putative cobalt transporter subunit CbtA [Actinocrispum wychmicini]
MGNLLVRGMLVGLAAAALALIFASLFGEPSVDSAISFEGMHSHGADEGPELVSRSIQSTLGLAVAVGAYGLAFGGLFALGFAFAYGRLGRLNARATAEVLALGAFVVVFVVPYLKYPANPPSVGQPDTIGSRTAWYFSMVLVSVVAGIGSTVLARRLLARFGAWNSVLLGLLAYVAVVSVASAILPVVSEVPEHFPASVLWNFRVASLGTQLVLWMSIGLLFGVLTERRLRRVAGQAVTLSS